MGAADRREIDPEVWTPGHTAVIKAAARDPHVERIFVNAAIKKALCRDTDPDRSWMNKVRPYWGHDYHFHVRLKMIVIDRKSTRLNSSHQIISYAVFCLKKKNQNNTYS